MPYTFPESVDKKNVIATGKTVGIHARIHSSQLEAYFPALSSVKPIVKTAMFASLIHDFFFDVMGGTSVYHPSVTDAYNFSRFNRRGIIQSPPQHYVVNGQLQSMAFEALGMVRSGAGSSAELVDTALLPVARTQMDEVNIGTKKSALELAFALEEHVLMTSHAGLKDITKGHIGSIVSNLRPYYQKNIKDDLKKFFGLP